MATPRTATLTGTVNWSNGSPFDGYVLLGIVLPAGYTSASPIGASPGLAVPQFIKIPIVASVFSPAVTPYFNADLEPPNCRYAAYWYDMQDALISGPSAIFDITSTPYAITLPSLTAPAAGVTAPTPPTSPS